MNTKYIHPATWFSCRWDTIEHLLETEVQIASSVLGEVEVVRNISVYNLEPLARKDQMRLQMLGD